ncbi:signal transduction histidine kinase [Mucilaginibacter gracilis]|uniref:histidine kinase n=1 Tax=Mucilaginibacter gracilis TaxID=423350 RepID=A0A495J6C8_9SPHI|nr:HAMP domain-containing sensor histidine kinase [Mucilaginibacter gracilis]RKR84556.1 signal transduction histidine kinase [Mucilaginibacter gracilis]
MKLSAHYNKASIIATVTVLIFGAIVYFFAISYISKNQIDQDLSEELEEVIDYVNAHHQLPKSVDFDEDQTFFFKTTQKSFKTQFYDSVYKNPKENRNEAGRTIAALIKLNEEYYKVTITISRESTEYLIQIIAAITLGLMTVLLIILFLTNRFVLNGLWKPFYILLNQIKLFKVSETTDIKLINSNVDEFNELNNAIQIMASRVKTDFQHLKNFTENASHEMLTPLAVITSKLDTLIQDETLRPSHYKQINDIYAATNKLSRLNQSLLLIVKIENNLLDDVELINLEKLLIEKGRQFQELISSKQLTIVTDLKRKEIRASKYLIDMLLNNLFSNSIRHSANHGEINIHLSDTYLIFRNSGLQALDAENVFLRFQKGKHSEGTGLGLTIVQNICSSNHWAISYSFQNAMHSFKIVF